MNRANLEVLTPKFGSSYLMKHYLLPNQNNKAYSWHFHPEVELVFVKGGKGVRHIGNHLSHYTNGDLVLIGSNLPHKGFTNKNTGNSSEVVIQFLPDFMGQDFFQKEEMGPISAMLKRALQGISFHGKTKISIGRKMEKLSGLANFESLLLLLSILNELANSKEYELLNAASYSFQHVNQDSDRIADVFSYIEDNYNVDLTLDQAAKISNMTIPSFCRYFKKLTDRTFTQFVNEFRIIKACKLLSDETDSIGSISFRVGYNSLSYFNKQFKQVTAKTPANYRKEFMNIVSEK